MELTGEQMLETLIVHDQHHQVDAFDSDLQSPTSSTNRDEPGRTPAFSRTASGHATSVLAAKMKPPTKMHFTLLNVSSGMPLSGVAIMACRTSTDDCRRATESSRAEPAHA